MGSACCVAARDRTITDRSGSDVQVVTRNDRYSPSWSFRWDNRGRVAGEESSMNCFSDGVITNDRLDNKSHTTVETAYATEEGSPLDSSRSLTWQKSSSPSQEIGFPQSHPLNSKNLPEGKESMGTPLTSDQSPTKTSTPPHSTSSLSASPLSSTQGHLPPLSTLTPSRWPRPSPNHHHHLLRQVSDSRIRGIMSPNFSISEDGSPSPFTHPGWANKSTRGSHGGSSDASSDPTYSELMAIYNNSKRWSFDSESLSFSRDRVSRCSGRVSSSPSIDVQPCGVCSKLLTERSYWGSQKVAAAAGLAANGLPVAAVLICGHVYHAECLENMTPEVNKYDPACPVCTFGEKKVFKLSEKARGEMDLKGKIGKLRKRVIDGDSVLFDGVKSRGPRMGASSSMKSSSGIGKPFLRRHFSFGYKPNRSLSDNGSRKKKFFWSKSNKE
ncbi:uncharacterized protein LOC111919110 [Lactuca sativa]|uniref:uncharacterized protein LOC111919110 n=1 Tax=Lactuca sativa TaxID=4236 RepID=UPI0022AE91AD|nr:uncharacterized protein LOC111919110 [Lactuca sativa]XP_052621285.1 uncharacterized protein LOC111919110 [Lactuca sativa]XP_052621286.1 uncharacterized protein LOC111919110 [Lactuca sativa]